MQTNTSQSAKDLILLITSQLISRYQDISYAKNTAWLILQFATGYTKAQLLVNSQINISQSQLKKIDDILQIHIKKHKPIQYIFQQIPFLDLAITLKTGTLIPRQETEYWCNDLIENLKKANLTKEQQKSLTILDLCTGTGCIGLSLAKAFPLSTIYALDISNDAYKLSKKNAELNAITNVIFLKSDLYNKIPKKIKFDLVVSNPPYISYKRWRKLDPMVKNWESPTALKAKNSGTYLIKKIIKQAPQWLKENAQLKKAGIPQLIIEMDDNQGKKVSKLLKHYGFNNIIVEKDLAGMDRVIHASVKKR